MKNGYHEWFKKADEDDLSARAVLQNGAPSTDCFLSQQIAEKYLKGLLVFHKQAFPKTHDLLDLETLLLKVELDIGHVHEDAQLLNRYYVETRYPGDYPEFSFEECKSRLQCGTPC